MAAKKGNEALSKKELTKYREAFSVFDNDGDGQISKAELKQVMVSLKQQCTDADIEKMIRRVDVNKDGKVSFNEFVKMMIKMQSTPPNLRDAFDIFDQDKSGTISVTELKAILSAIHRDNWTEKELRNVVQRFDKDKDGRINFEEFEALCREKI